MGGGNSMCKCDVIDMWCIRRTKQASRAGTQNSKEGRGGGGMSL